MELREEFGEYLSRARQCYSQAEIARHMQCDARQVRRWEIGECTPKPYAVERLKQLPLFAPNGGGAEGDFTFIDLFAGIGGFRLGFEEIGGKCLFTSEWDRYCQKTYHENFQVNHPIAGDITKVPIDEIPEHDVLLAGFPCQPFSIAGVSKKNSLGRNHGFMCKAQGTLFFDIARIIKERRPKAFLLENVKNLRSHDRGRTFEVIMGTLRDELGYHNVQARVIDAKHLVPQHRERIFIVGFRDPAPWDWDALRLPEKGTQTMSSVLHSRDREEPEHDRPKGYTNGRGVNPKYILSDKLWNYLQQYALNHRARGNGFGFGLVGPDDTARTLSARYYKDGSEILVRRRGNPRRLTPRECARLMGYPDSFRIPVSDTQAYKQFGNSVVPLLVMEIARIMRPLILDDHVQQSLPVGVRETPDGAPYKRTDKTIIA